MFQGLSIDAAMQENAELSRWLMDRVGNVPRLQERGENLGIKLAVHELLMDEKSLSRGEFLSRVMRLPDAWRNGLMEYVNSSPPYSSSGFDLRVTLSNVGTLSCQIVDHAQTIAVPNRSTGHVDGGVHTTVAHRRVVEPGEEIELPATWAIAGLHRYGRYAMGPHNMSRHGRIDTNDRPLVEVAYKARFFDVGDIANPVERTIDSRAWQAEHGMDSQELVAAAVGPSSRGRRKVA